MDTTPRILQVGVKIAIIRNGKILLLKHADGKYAEIKVDRWDIVGGRINPGTPLLENLKREVFEETKMELTGTPRLVYAQDILKGTEKHVVRLTYVGEAIGEPILDEEHDEWRWTTMEELKQMGESLDDFFREVVENNIIVI